MIRRQPRSTLSASSAASDVYKRQMYAAPGIGLAAVQIGVPKRVIVIDLSKDGEIKNPMYFVNPEILKKSETMLKVSV